VVMQGSIVASITPSWRYRDHSLIVKSGVECVLRWRVRNP
jgi:hypothetical protein